MNQPTEPQRTAEIDAAPCEACGAPVALVEGERYCTFELGARPCSCGISVAGARTSHGGGTEWEWIEHLAYPDECRVNPSGASA